MLSSSRRESLKQNDELVCVIERRKTQKFETFAIPIEKLYGNLFVESEGHVISTAFKDGMSFQTYMNALKSYRLNSKNHANMFLTKGRVLNNILFGLLTELEKKLVPTFRFYENQFIQLKKHFEGREPDKQEIEKMNNFVSFLKNLKIDIEKKSSELKKITSSMKNPKGENPFLVAISNANLIYSNAVSRLIRNLVKTTKNTSEFVILENNCFTLEFHLLIMFEFFRRWLLRNIVSSIYIIHESFQRGLEKGDGILEDLRPNLNSITSNQSFGIPSLLEQNHKRFIKKKINLLPKIILTDESLYEFFYECYHLHYNSSSFYCRYHIKCKSISKEHGKCEVILAIDVITF